jgi:hypothetical protein
MKKLIALLLVAAGFASAATWYQRTEPGKPIVLEKEQFSVLLADVKLDPEDTVYSRAVDLFNIPYTYRDTGTGDAVVLPDFTLGRVMVSCYDVSDSSGVTDSVDVTGQLYKSQYAGDNADPGSGKSDAWATLGSALSIDDASASSAILEATAAVTLASELDRFVRIRLINDHAVAKDVSRCRVYLVNKAVRR